MRGRSGCPTGQEKNSVGATGESLSDFLQGKVGYRVAPSSDPASPAHLPPEGKALGEMSPIWKPSFTNMLSNIFSPENASQIGLGIPEETAPLSYQRQRSPKRASESERAINPGSRGLPLVFFPPTFFKESRAPPRSSAGNPRCRAHPATVPTEPPADDRGPPPGRRGNGALRPEASEKPRPPAGYAVPPPPRPPAPPAGPRRLPRRREFNIIR